MNRTNPIDRRDRGGCRGPVFFFRRPAPGDVVSTISDWFRGASTSWPAGRATERAGGWGSGGDSRVERGETPAR
ncbi:MAG: hypothetical protein CMJ54_07350 [Planctomycetaceae bacterium]|nr:hypothetical protein [Planctomycetaceae bacterium]